MKQLPGDEPGQSLVEYALLLVLVTVVVIIMLVLLGHRSETLSPM